MPDDAEPCFVFDPEAPPTVEGSCVLGELTPEYRHLPARRLLRHRRAHHVFGNCTGILLLAGAPGPLTNWKIRHNLAKANNRTDGGEEDPVPSGIGILLLGAADNDISGNLVLGNRGSEELGGGIVLVTGGEPGGEQFAPSGNTVRRNVAFKNQPFDLFWDGTGTGVRFKGNRCATSQPEGLCD